MPTDDDYGRRERLPLHQHNATQFGSTASTSSQAYSTCSTTSASIGSGNISLSKPSQNCVATQDRSDRSAIVVPIPSAECRYQKRGPPGGGGGGGVSHPVDDYSGRYDPRHGSDRYEKPITDQQSSSEQNCYEESRRKDNNNRYSQQHGSASPYQYFAVRIGFGADRYSGFGEQRSCPVLGVGTTSGTSSVDDHRGGQRGPGSTDRYQHSVDRFHQTGSTRVRDSNESDNNNHYVDPSGFLSSELFPSPPSPAPANDRFVPPPPLSPTPSERYTSLQSLEEFGNDEKRVTGSPSAKDRFNIAPGPGSPMPSATKERFTPTERLLANASPVVGPIQSDSRIHYDKDTNGASVRYNFSTERLLLSSSPVPGQILDRFGTRDKAQSTSSSSPRHDKYHHAERYLSSSPNPEGARQRYSSSERVLRVPSPAPDQQNSSRQRNAVTAESRYSVSGSVSQNDPRHASAHQDQRRSPEVQTHHRYSLGDHHSNDLVLHSRYGQPRIDRLDRFASDHHPSGTRASYGSGVSNAATERLAASSSPLLDTPRYGHHASAAPPYSSPSSQTNSGTNRYSSSMSPTMERPGRLYPTTGTKSCDDEYFPPSKPVPNYPIDLQFDRTTSNQGGGSIIERSNRLDRFQLATSDRFHCAPTGDLRYSVVDKYLSLPKSNDRLSNAGSVAVSGSACPPITNDRAYVSAHTPVERYVPQPPPEILYSGYVDPYGHQAHTPTDRYVSVMDPGDPYMRRDLGFHHHYRLPPPAYPYHHQSHYRFRGYTYASPARLGGSPGSSSSGSSSTSAQREFNNSPLLRPKVKVSAVEFSASNHIGNSHVCCTDSNQGPATPQRCCAPGRRSLTPCTASVNSVPTQTNPPTSWQSSSGSRVTSTPTILSSGQQDNVVVSQNIGNSYVVVGATVNGSSGSTGSTVSTGSSGSTGSTGSSGSTESTGSTGSAETNESGGVKIMESSTTSISNTSSPAVPLTTNDSSNLARSASAPTGPRPVVEQIPSFASHSNEFQRHRLQRNASRSDAIKSYIKRETATFFGVNEESEAQEKQRWLERRRRMASRKYGSLLPEYRPRDPDITRDVPDFADVPEGVTLRRWYQPVRRKESVARMTLSGLSYMVSQTLARNRPPERTETRPESRSFPPSTVPSPPGSPDTFAVDDEPFFERPPLPPPPPPPPPPPTPPPLPPSTLLSSAPQFQAPIDRTMQQPSVSEDERSAASLRDENDIPAMADLVDASASVDRDFSEELVRFTIPKEERTLMSSGKEIRRPVPHSRDRYTSRSSSWRRPREPGTMDTTTTEDDVVLRRQAIGGSRISPNTIDRIFDNSNRRQYGMGIVGRFFGRSFRKSVAQKPEVKKQLDDIEDHRPFFTYWITTVQVLILVISLACYGFGPFGFELSHRSGLVLVTSLSLQQVDYQEPANFWIGPRAADLIHLGAKFAPCMRRDIKILNEIDVWRERERDTACCIRNDDSGCVQSSKQECSNTISTWKKWGPGDNGPGGRISGSVCGLDPKFCDAPASIAPYEWPDDITKWPICRKTNPFSQRFSKGNNDHFSVGRHLDKMAEHMVCEVIGHPCCIGIHGMCRITTKEYCDFVHGYFHEEASLCSQVECLHDVCGMIPFLHPEWPDQFYRLFTSLFLHAGIIHIAITLCVQYFFMRDLEKLTGSLRIAIIYFTGGLTGNLASAIFVPYRAEVGPAGAHFALLATLVVEVLNSWPMLKHPRRALMKLLGSVFCLLLLGTLPWVDNYAHLFGFIFGFLAAYAVMPFISFGEYDRRRKILLIWICLILIVGLFAILLVLFYNISVYECEVCKLFTCIPFTRDFCASQNINFKKEEPV